ncbi:MAG: DNA repair protein RecN, partial [Desulfobacterales bacterium]|nr:DNA repair protein RecN [Desulfobacterales bacterium]
MLQELSIKNFAIIDDLTIRFNGGFTILSGETGAGKSIIINAVNLLLGSRASAKMVRTGAEAAELEALFAVPAKSRTAKIMADQGYDAQEGLIIRRVISAGDRHRVYINGHLATMQALGEITRSLASISGQHAHQVLLREDEQLGILDRFGGLDGQREKVARGVREIQELIKDLKRLKTREKRSVEQRELLEFQKSEIDAAAILPGEDEALESERKRLKYAETLYGTVFQSVETLYSSEGAAMERLATARADLEKAGDIDPVLSQRAKELSEAVFQVEDVVQELRSYLGNIEVDDKRLEAVEERLDALGRLKKKYGGTLDAVLAFWASIDAKLAEIENLSGEVIKTEAALAAKNRTIGDLAMKLSKKRKQAGGRLSKLVAAELAGLEMQGTRFEVVVAPVPADERADASLVFKNCLLTENGIDSVSVLIAPNVGEDLKPLSKIASGGELSRVVLALKVILAGTESVETVVFDEVDAGIGGGVAEVVGKKLADLAGHCQVICITHLPQIARFGDNHFLIFKKVKNKRTLTFIEPLDADQRVQEMARML